MSSKRVLTMALATFVMAFGTVAAQGAESDGQGPPVPVRVVAGFLELTPEQAEGLVEGIQESRLELTPVAAQVRGLQEALEQLLQSESPDEQVVGQLVLEIRDLKGEAGEIRREFVESFVASLDEEQRAKLAFVHRAARIQEILPAFKVTGLLP